MFPERLFSNSRGCLLISLIRDKEMDVVKGSND